MRNIFKFIIFIISPFIFTSCSVIWGGIVAIDNSINKGPHEIDLNKLGKLKNGKKVILDLKDSTEISGSFQVIKDNSKNDLGKIIVIANNEGQKQINTSDVNKYIYIDEGGNVWLAAAIGAIFDAIIIYTISHSHKSGMGITLSGPL